MAKLTKLSEIIEFNSDFRNAINLYLSLNKEDKILSYIPTKSSVNILTDYLDSVYGNKEQATLLIGPYGKGKSHLLLVLLAVLSMKRNEKNTEIINKLVEKIYRVDEIGKSSAKLISTVWNQKKPFLPVIVMSTQGDLNQSFLIALNETLKREGLEEIVPDTYFSIALKRIDEWKKKYKETYVNFENMLKEFSMTGKEMSVNLSQFDRNALNIFCNLYPKITSGSVFNPLATSEVLPLFKSVSEKICNDYNYSGIYVIFDEFSKFIEGQDKLLAGNNMKLLQDICELATDSKEAQVFITMVAHKSIKEYGKYLSADTINSFTGIEGRLKEKFFITSSKNNYELIQNAIIKKEDNIKNIPLYEELLSDEAKTKYYQIPVFKSNFNENDFKNIVLKGCYPLNPISAYLLLNISEKVAQNERTLFTFVSKDEQHSMARYVSEHTADQDWSIGADMIYDYFSGLFKKEVTNEFIHNEWLNAEYAISKCTTILQKRMIKVLAVILIVNKEEELPASDIYLQMASHIPFGADIITQLVDNQIIYKKGSTNCYVFKTRAGSALKNEIKKQRELKGENVNLASVFLDITDKYFVIPRKYNQEFMMTRYFRHEYMDVDIFLNIHSVEAFFNESEFADGKVITLYSLDGIDRTGEIKERIAQYSNRKLIITYSYKAFDFIDQAKDYEIIQELKKNNTFTNNNEILKRELPLMEEDLSKELISSIIEIFEENESHSFYYDGENVVESKGITDEQLVNTVCEKLYFATPIINNELINRREIGTTQTKKARKTIVEAVLNHMVDDVFCSGTNQEATIYRSLFKVTGIDSGSEQKEMTEILNIINIFVNECSDVKKPLKLLLEQLTSEPYAIRSGIIPIYLAYILAKRNEDIIVYFDKLEVQLTADIVINMCESPADYYMFVSKEDMQKEKYIKQLQQLFHVEENFNLSDSRISDILSCIQRWFRALPQVSRTMNNPNGYKKAEQLGGSLSKIRNLLQKINANPYEILFVNLPELFDSVGDYDKTFEMIVKCQDAFDGYYEWLVKRTSMGTIDVFARKSKEDLYHVIQEWYEKQSEMSKQGLHSGRITNFMTCIEKLNTFDDSDITKKIVKAVTDVYLENWNDNSLSEYLVELKIVKEEVEAICDEQNSGKLKLSFTGKNSREIEKYYDRVDEKTGSVLRNILEDTIDEYDDLSVNDRVAILLEMIERVIE